MVRAVHAPCTLKKTSEAVSASGAGVEAAVHRPDVADAALQIRRPGRRLRPLERRGAAAGRLVA